MDGWSKPERGGESSFVFHNSFSAELRGTVFAIDGPIVSGGPPLYLPCSLVFLRTLLSLLSMLSLTSHIVTLAKNERKPPRAST